MGSGAPDSMWIREINTIKAERDKAIADRDRIRRILRERDAVGQWQIDELLGRLEYDKAATMSDQQTTEWGLEARWVPFPEREPEPEKVVLARETGGEVFGSVYRTEPEDDERVYIQNGEFYLGWEEVIDLEWLEVKEKGGE